MSGRSNKAKRKATLTPTGFRSRWTAWRLSAIASIGILLVVLVVVFVLFLKGSGNGGSLAGPPIKFVGNDSCPTSGAQPYGSTAPAINSSPAVGKAIGEMPHTHVNPPAKVTYLHNPPTSGCHYNLGYGTAPITAGVYDHRVEPENFVHNLEHGYIIIYYNCPQGCADDINKLNAWYKSLSPDPKAGTGYAKVLVLPWTDTNMHEKFAAASWDWYDPMPTALDMNEVQRFYDNHLDQSPESNQAP